MMFKVYLLLFSFSDLFKYGHYMPIAIMINNFVVCFFFAVSSGFVLNNNDVNNVFYDLDNIDTNENRPEIHYLQKSADDHDVKLSYDVINFDNLKYPINEDGFKDYVMIKAKRKLMDMSPYVMMKQLDDVKYMVLWLNLYCEMHPDCNKKTLNEELRKVRSEDCFILSIIKYIGLSSVFAILKS